MSSRVWNVAPRSGVRPASLPGKPGAAELRRRGVELPVGLVGAGCRAPAFRLDAARLPVVALSEPPFAVPFVLSAKRLALRRIVARGRPVSDL
jgi:hypothetical protein